MAGLAVALADFLRSLPSRFFDIEEELFRDVSVKLADAEVHALVDLALEGAMARRARGEDVTPVMVSALVRLETAAHAPQGERAREA